jgi:hypothetical protein
MNDKNVIQVDVPEWGETYIRQLSVAERLKFWTGLESVDHVGVYLLLYCLCDRDGKRLYGDDDFNEIADRNAIVVDRVASVAGAHSHLTRNAVDEAKKNCEPNPNAVPSTASVSN